MSIHICIYVYIYIHCWCRCTLRDYKLVAIAAMYVYINRLYVYMLNEWIIKLCKWVICHVDGMGEHKSNLTSPALISATRDVHHQLKTRNVSHKRLRLQSKQFFYNCPWNMAIQEVMRQACHQKWRSFSKSFDIQWGVVAVTASVAPLYGKPVPLLLGRCDRMHI